MVRKSMRLDMDSLGEHCASIEALGLSAYCDGVFAFFAFSTPSPGYGLFFVYYYGKMMNGL
jgi:hypothetical protein